MDEVTYIQKISLIALNGGLWGDCFVFAHRDGFRKLLEIE